MLLHWNILDGCVGDPARLARVGAWISAQGAEVVTLNECNGWHEGDFAGRAAAWGYPYAHLLVSASGYHVAILAKQPLRQVVEHRTALSKGALQATVGELTIITTHFYPTNYPADVRLAEAVELARIARAVPGPLLLAGDLNCLAPADAAHYAHLSDLAWALEYQQFATLLAVGLIDTGAGPQPGFSVPTPLSRNYAQHPRLRFDYCLANAAMAARLPLSRIVSNDEVRQCSDHLPLICHWQPLSGA